MAEQFQLSVLTPRREIFSGPVDTVTAVGFRGEFGVLPGHVAYITSVHPGPLTLRAGKKEQRFFVGDGFAQVAAEKVSIVVSIAEEADTIDVDAAQSALADAQHRLGEEGGDLSAAEFDQAMALGRLTSAR